MYTKKCFYCMVVAVLLLCSSKIMAQSHVSGNVTDSLGNPIFRAYVMEMNSDHRILNQTTTDRKGNFVMSVRDTVGGYLRVTADGYTPMRERIRKNQQMFAVQMAARPQSRLDMIMKAYGEEKRRYVHSRKLLCGRSGSHEEPWMVSVERLTDSLYVLQLPVKAAALSSTYKEGRMLIFLDQNDYHLVMSYNAEDALAYPGAPDVMNAWDRNSINRLETFRLKSGSQEMDEEEMAYFYPQFILTQEDIDMLLSQTENLARLAVDTETADNYWLIYPMESFGKELRKIMNKLTN